MSNYLLLDCTLRDGGYINNWRFGRNSISAICRKLAAAKIDIIEAGFLTDKPHTADDSLFANCEELDAVLERCKSGASRIAAMIAIGEMEMNPERLLRADRTRLDIVRITFHNTRSEVEKMVRFTKCLHAKGYKVCVQPVGTTSYTDKELLELIELVNGLEPYAFYLVDTLGILQRKQLLHFIDLIDHNLTKGIKLGFHSHNNLQMSYANAQDILDYSSNRDFILDSSIFGMGRGAGNLCTELIAQYENSIGKSSYELTQLYDIIDDYIYPIFISDGWGYNSRYFIAAAHECHPNYASFLMNKQTLTMNEVDLILRNIPREKRAVYDKELIEELYYSFQSRVIDDSAGRRFFAERIRGRNILLVAPGKSISRQSEEIRRFIEDNEPVIISVNMLPEALPSDYVFVSNWKRLFMLDTEKLHVPVILTSNLPNIIQDGISVDYTSLCVPGDEPDNSGMMLLRLMHNLGLKKVYIAGYDGFSEDAQENYFDGKLINSVDPQSLTKKNEVISEQIRQIQGEIEIVSLTPTRYINNAIPNDKKLVVFDLDGTLADTSPGILECHRYTNSQMGRPIRQESELDGIIGAPLLDTYLNRFGYTEQEAKEAVRIYRERYEKIGVEKSVLYPGMSEVLASLKQRGYLLAVATLKADGLAKKVLKAMGIDKYFDVIHGVDMRDALVKADLVLKCISDLGVSRNNTTLIGDSVHDSMAAEGLGINFLGVTYGFGFTKGQDQRSFPLADEPGAIVELLSWRYSMKTTITKKCRGGVL